MTRNGPSATPTARDLRAGLLRGEIGVEFQPKVRLSDRRLLGVEALARWHRASGERVSPAVFIPLAEEAGLIGQVTQAVLHRSLPFIMEFRRTRPSVTIAVNVSPYLLCKPGFARHFELALAEYDVPPEAVIVEVTETAAISDNGPAARAIRALRAMGVECALDDFGTGYASLASLLRLPFAELKIDHAFTSACAASQNACKIVQSTLQLGRDLGLRVVVEGIETAADDERFLDFGCEIGQGFYYGAPARREAWVVTPEFCTPAWMVQPVASLSA